MPIYEYECPKCGRFDAMQGVNDKPLKSKPDCDIKNCPKKAVKVMSASSFHLVGGGWYKTDYASGANKGTGKSEPAKPAETSSEKKKESDDSGNKGGGGCGSGCSCH